MRPKVHRRLALAFLGLAAVGAARADEAPRARIDSGPVVGVASGPAAVFRAIPYAAPPVGDLRWRPPAPAAPWSADRQAITAGPACPQKVSPIAPNGGGYVGPVSEDCLTLDVTAPKGGLGRPGKTPVMVWIFGGGNTAGASNLPSYDAVNFARDGVIVVAMNYRLGALGFFAHPALTAEAGPRQPLGSYGLMDQIAALQWVKRNIAAFGGDPANVTVFGESAGGADTLQLLATPSARGLFARAIVQSGGGWSAPRTLAQAEARGAALATTLGVTGATADAGALRALPVQAILDAQTTGLGEYGPIVDGRLIRESPAQAFARGDAEAVPLIIGSNSNEASLRGPADAAAAAVAARAGPALRAVYAPDAASEAALGRAMFNDAVMGGPARWIAGKASQRAPAWLYYFSYVPERQRGVRPGTNHASEIPFVFDSLDAVPGRTPLITPSERAEAALAHACWVDFARSGRPACGGRQPWPAYTPAADALLEFGDPAGVRTHFRKAQLDLQEALAADRLSGGPPAAP